MFLNAAGLQMMHVPYQGGGPAVMVGHAFGNWVARMTAEVAKAIAEMPHGRIDEEI